MLSIACNEFQTGSPFKHKSNLKNLIDKPPVEHYSLEFRFITIPPFRTKESKSCRSTFLPRLIA